MVRSRMKYGRVPDCGAGNWKGPTAVSVEPVLQVHVVDGSHGINYVVIEVSLILFGMQTYINTLNKDIKFYIKNSEPFLRNRQ